MGGGPRPSYPPAVISLMLSALVAQNPGALGGYRMGMSRAEVQAVKDCAPYKEVPGTGGLECPSFKLDGKKRHISFLFDEAAGLKKIQLWFGEGLDAAKAEAALSELVAHLEQSYGTLESTSLGMDVRVTAKALMEAAAKSNKAQLKPRRNPKDKFVFGSVLKDEPHGWFVFMYVQPPRPVAEAPPAHP